MASNKKILINRLVEKSKEAFIFAIEIINKPTIKHRSENFAFNMCNAWELLLKAKMVRDLGENTIYFKNHKDRTVEFRKCINTVFTDFSNPVKKNIEKIQSFRNKSIHFVTPEYDDLYIGVFQANVIYYTDFLRSEFSININDELPSNFLTFAANPKAINDIKFIDRVDAKTFQEFLQEKKSMNQLETVEGISITFDVGMRNVKKGEDFTYRIDPNADLTTQIIKTLMDPNNTHPYRQKEIINMINSKYGNNTINQYSFRAIKHYENIGDDDIEYVYNHKKLNTKTYSKKMIDLITKNIEGAPNYLEIVIEEYKNKK